MGITTLTVCQRLQLVDVAKVVERRALLCSVHRVGSYVMDLRHHMLEREGEAGEHRQERKTLHDVVAAR